MTREIKFRAWNKEYGMIYDSLEPKHEIYVHPDSEIMLFTGLHDKNGNEIFEGDLIEILYGQYSSNPTKQLHKVEWHDLFWDVKRIYNGEISSSFYTDGGCSDDFGFFSFHESEVIGNIYERPELLEKKD